MKDKPAVAIIGAGPAGLAAGITLAEAQKNVLILEKDQQVGGISKTINYKGYRFDLGSHRFHTKIKAVNNLWGKTLGQDLLTRSRLSRIYYQNKFFYYPLRPLNALAKLGFKTAVSVLLSFVKFKLFPYTEEKTFTQWVSNRFGKRLFEIFFKSYTEKLWGISCDQIQADWAAQRIGSLSLLQAIKDAFSWKKDNQIKTLIDKFKYPKYGSGMMYEKMADQIINLGSQVTLDAKVVSIEWCDHKIVKLKIQDKASQTTTRPVNQLISSMPVTELIKQMTPRVPEAVLQAVNNLKYRGFIAVDLILEQAECFPDHWIYIHSTEVKLGRIQNFNNWSPYMAADNQKTTLGLEYFCDENDDFWNTDDSDLIKIALKDLQTIGLGNTSKFMDGFVIRVPYAYPIYDQNYHSNLKIILDFLKKFNNLQTIGRNGLFRYNNMDHSVLTGIKAAQVLLKR